MGTVVKIKLPHPYPVDAKTQTYLKLMEIILRMPDNTVSNVWYNKMQYSYWVTFNNEEDAFFFKMKHDFEYIS